MTDEHDFMELGGDTDALDFLVDEIRRRAPGMNATADARRKYSIEVAQMIFEVATYSAEEGYANRGIEKAAIRNGYCVTCGSIGTVQHTFSGYRGVEDAECPDCRADPEWYMDIKRRTGRE